MGVAVWEHGVGVSTHDDRRYHGATVQDRWACANATHRLLHVQCSDARADVAGLGLCASCWRYRRRVELGRLLLVATHHTAEDARTVADTTAIQGLGLAAFIDVATTIVPSQRRLRGLRTRGASQVEGQRVAGRRQLCGASWPMYGETSEPTTIHRAADNAIKAERIAGAQGR